METSCYKNRTVADGFETLIELTYREKRPNTSKSNIVMTQPIPICTMMRRCCK